MHRKNGNFVYVKNAVIGKRKKSIKGGCRMKIKRVKKNPYIINKEIRFRLMMCGLGQIIDGLVMFLLFGEVTSNFALITAKKMA